MCFDIDRSGSTEQEIKESITSEVQEALRSGYKDLDWRSYYDN